MCTKLRRYPDISVYHCMQFCVSLMLTSVSQGEVITDGNITAYLDKNRSITCKLSKISTSSNPQFRWERLQEGTIAHYYDGKVVITDAYKDRLNLSLIATNQFMITYHPLKDNDSGCYLCNFDVYPTGFQSGEVCITLLAEVKSTGNVTINLGKPATVSCSYEFPDQVIQVLWNKYLQENKMEIIASHNKYYPSNIPYKYKDKIFFYSSGKTSKVVFKALSLQDEACYMCEYNLYPYGTKSISSCITVLVPPKYNSNYELLLDGFYQLNCSAFGKPAPIVRWNMTDGDIIKNVTYITEMFDNGTTLVISRGFGAAAIFNERRIVCIIDHPSLTSPITVEIKENGSSALLIAVMIGTAVLIICLCICMWKCLVHQD
ncbi:LOW QUALITY PROTEIN: OX-2 membrane glycoprotein [Polypterus senegalus]|uniref:LOW QUALITY PROTEIN: OX-2 membrane glycoprotein n=1 Tax=Polypterus senegalus TaxID=55291 RepID=UPI0019633CAC|nr:LOW QUALITY PROTEIN: OX-2 membrane glycoprotein [Polypterus senegalus]